MGELKTVDDRVRPSYYDEARWVAKAAWHRRLMPWVPSGPGGAHATSHLMLETGRNWEEQGRSLTKRGKLGETETNSFFFTEPSASTIGDIRERS